MKAPSLVTEMHYDATSGPGEAGWEGKTGTWRTGQRQAFKTKGLKLTKIQQQLFFPL